MFAITFEVVSIKGCRRSFSSIIIRIQVKNVSLSFCCNVFYNIGTNPESWSLLLKYYNDQEKALK